MNRFIFLLSSMLVIFACSNKEISDTQETDVHVIYGIDLCCSNMVLKSGQDPVFSTTENRLDSILAGVNMDAFIQDLDLQTNDELLIDFNFTDKPNPYCDYTCNRHNALRIEVSNVVKL